MFFSENPECYPCYTFVEMHPIFEANDLLQLVVDFVGFVPSRFYLRECSRFLHQEVNGVVLLSPGEYFEALERKLVNPKYLKLRVSTLSDSLISKLSFLRENRQLGSLLLESLLQGRSIDELMILRERSLITILECSVVRMNIRLFEIAFKCIEARGPVTEIVSELLRFENVKTSLVQADAVELLAWMLRQITNNRESLVDSLLVFAIKFRARRCEDYLRDFARDWTKIPGMLEATAYAGDFERVKVLCSAGESVSVETIHAALKQAVGRRHLRLAAFLRHEWNKRNTCMSWDARRTILRDLLTALKSTHRRREDDRWMCGGPSERFLSYIFDGIDAQGYSCLSSVVLDDFVRYDGIRSIMHNLARCRGWTALDFRKPLFTVERKDLFEFFDWCHQWEQDAFYDTGPAVELFFLKRGICIWQNDGDANTVIQILEEAFQASSFSNRVELIKHHLLHDPKLATKMGSFQPGDSSKLGPFSVTPLGALDVLGTPRTEIWTGKNVLGYADFVPITQMEDEWKLSRPNDMEIRALREIRSTLLEYDADPELLFAPDALNDLVCKGHNVSIKLIRRVLDGRADVNHTGRTGFTPLSWVLSNFSNEMVKVADLLLEYGADMDANDCYGRTAMVRAITRNELQSFEWLVEHGADLSIPDSAGSRAIDFARTCAYYMQWSTEILERIEQITQSESNKTEDVE